MKYIFTLLFLSSIAYSMSINKVRVDLQLIHQQNTETVSPIIFEPGPVFDENYDTPTITPTVTPTVTPTDTPTVILYIVNDNTNTNTNNQNPYNHPNILLPNHPIY